MFLYALPKFSFSRKAVCSLWCLLFIAGCLLAVATAAQTRRDAAGGRKPAAASQKPDETRFIVTAFSVNLRETSSAGAKQVGQLPVGTIVRGLERSAEKQNVGGRTDYWRRVETVAANGKKQGWLFGGFLREFNEARRETIYREVVAERAKAAGEKFAENAELYEFLTRAATEIKTPAIAAEIGFARLTALKNALAAIPFDKQSDPLYKNFTAKHNANIAYSDPSGQWYVRSNLFWDLARKYKNLPVAEEIAWTAANNPLPGECEGYLNCYLYLLTETYGKYLDLYPRGAHALESLKEINEFLQQFVDAAKKKEFYTAPTEASEKAEFYKAIAQLRVRISKTGLFEKDAALKKLNQIAEAYK